VLFWTPSTKSSINTVLLSNQRIFIEPSCRNDLQDYRRAAGVMSFAKYHTFTGKQKFDADRHDWTSKICRIEVRYVGLCKIEVRHVGLCEMPTQLGVMPDNQFIIFSHPSQVVALIPETICLRRRPTRVSNHLSLYFSCFDCYLDYNNR
jgi:hypothetical protein